MARTDWKLLLLDLGNTRVHAAVAGPDGQLSPLDDTPPATADAAPQWQRLVLEQGVTHLAWCSVRSKSITPDQFIHLPEKQAVEITNTTPCGVENRYRSPHTLGTDRLMAAAAAWAQHRKPCLVIDAGTALTYEYVNARGEYLGGAITPGLTLRYKALNDYTARLPLLSAAADIMEIGYDTETSIRSGVQYGLRAEMQSRIDHWHAQHTGTGIAVCLTGGDAPLFENLIYSSIFADPYLVLRGLYHTSMLHFRL